MDVYLRPHRQRVVYTNETRTATRTVKVPPLYVEAQMTITISDRVTGARTNRSAIAKIDTGAPISLAHPDLLNDIRPCLLHALPSARLRNEHGDTHHLNLAGTLQIRQPGGSTRAIQCLALNTQEDHHDQLCILGVNEIAELDVDTNYHINSPSWRGPAPMQFRHPDSDPITPFTMPSARHGAVCELSK